LETSSFTLAAALDVLLPVNCTQTLVSDYSNFLNENRIIACVKNLIQSH